MEVPAAECDHVISSVHRKYWNLYSLQCDGDFTFKWFDVVKMKSAMIALVHLNWSEICQHPRHTYVYSQHLSCGRCSFSHY